MRRYHKAGKRILAAVLAAALAVSVTVPAMAKDAGWTAKAGSSKGVVSLSWEKSEEAASYRVLRKKPGKGYKKVAETKQIKFSDKSVKTNRWYKYKVQALDADGKMLSASKSVRVYAVDTDPKKKMVALTFDDGPGRYTADLVKTLKKNHARATFFVIGQNIPSYHSAMEAAYDAGNEIGNHSYSHVNLGTSSRKRIKSQVNRTDKLIKKYTGSAARLLRPPYGAVSSTLSNTVKKPEILWSIDTLDWKTRSKSSTIKAVMNHVRDGDVILIHDIHEPSVAAAKALIPMLKKKGYQLVTVSEMAKYKKVSLKNGARYGRIG